VRAARLHRTTSIPDVVTHFTGFFAPRSYHPGGAAVLMGDGSVRFVSNNIDAVLHRALHSRDGRESASLP
jgi:prepilin-type processing-associated H-X9-DG protein